MVRVVKQSCLSESIKKNLGSSILVVVYTPGTDPSTMKNGSLADDLQHNLSNLCRSYDTVDVVLVPEGPSEVQIFQGQRLMHVVCNPTSRSVIEAYRIVTGRYAT